MSYMALYRKWRPDSFEEVKGQEHIVTTLKNQIVNDRIGHAYLFCGTRGTGKTTVAKLFAKTVNCENPVDGSPCGECAMCKAIAGGSAMNVIEIDAASNNGVDNIRQIRDEVQYSPSEGRYKVYIIDEVHMLSAGAFNALLKTLEEPPSYVIFILATTESHKIPVTISSRCQKYDFRRISVETISDRLMTLLERENVEAEREAIEYVAKAADGSMRDSLSILDQCIAFNLGQKLTYERVLETVGAVDIDTFARLFERIIDLDVIGAVDIVDEIIWQGRELGRFVSEFTWFMRNVLIVKVSPDGSYKLDMSKENVDRIKAIAETVDAETLMRYIKIFSDTAANIKYADQKRVVLELAVIKLCKPEMEENYDAILDRMRVLEKKMAEGIPVNMAATVGNAVAAPTAGSSQPGVAEALTESKQDPTAGMTPAEQERYKEKLKASMSEASYRDLCEFVDQWDILKQSHQKITQSYLEQAVINLAEDNRTLLLTYIESEETKQAIKYFKMKRSMERLKEDIETAMNRKISITLRVLNAAEAAKSNVVKEDLSKINFNIDFI